MENTTYEAKGTLMEALGIELVPAEKNAQVVYANMPVDHRTCQSYGFMSGGASLALAEALAGYGAVVNIPENQKPVGVTVSGNHMRPAPMSTWVHAKATILHKGRTNHVWGVEVTDDEGRMVSVFQVLIQIVSQ